jgi:hypothetical protein
MCLASGRPVRGDGNGGDLGTISDVGVSLLDPFFCNDLTMGRAEINGPSKLGVEDLDTLLWSD